MNGGYVGRRKINIMTPGATHFQRKHRKSIALDTRVGESEIYYQSSLIGAGQRSIAFK